MQNFIDNLSELLENCKNKETIEKDTGISSSSITKYLNKTLLPNVNTLIKLANYFNCSTDFLLGLITEDKHFSFNNSYIFDLNKFLARYKELKNNKPDYYIAKKAGFSNSVIYNWKYGRNPSLIVLVKLSEYFNCSLDYLIGRKDVK